MNDLVTRLRALANDWTIKHQFSHISDLAHEAADALEEKQDLDSAVAETVARQENAAIAAECLRLRDSLNAANERAVRWEDKVSEYGRELANLKAKLSDIVVAASKKHTVILERTEKAEADAAALRDEIGRTRTTLVEAIKRAGADNAALREAATALEQLLTHDLGMDKPELTALRFVLSQPGPGAAMLERVRKLEAVVEIVKSYFWARDREDLHQALAALEEKQ